MANFFSRIFRHRKPTDNCGDDADPRAAKAACRTIFHPVDSETVVFRFGRWNFAFDFPRPKAPRMPKSHHMPPYSARARLDRFPLRASALT